MTTGGSEVAANARRGDGGSRSRALGETRRAGILAWLQEEGSARVRVLAEAFDVSLAGEAWSLRAFGMTMRGRSGGQHCQR